MEIYPHDKFASLIEPIGCEVESFSSLTSWYNRALNPVTHFQRNNPSPKNGAAFLTPPL